MKITEISIKKPVFAWMIMASFIVFGLLSFKDLGVSEKPDVDFPVVNISVGWTGAAPEVIELDVIDQLESSLLSVEGIKSMNSQARRGRADVTVEFDIDKDIDIAVQEVQSVLSAAQRRLPDDIDPPVVRKSNPEDRPILWLSITSNKMTKLELMTYVRDQIKDRFQTVEGVSEVILGGYVDPNLRVWVNDGKLAKYDLSVLDVVSAISREHSEYPAGIFENPKEEYNVRVLGESNTVDDFQNITINQRGGSPIYTPLTLKEIAKVEDGLDDVRRISRVNGASSIGLGFRKKRGSNAVDVAKSVKEKMAQLAPTLPDGAEIGINYDGTVFIEDSIEELKFTLILSGVLTAAVVWIFLGSFGAAFNIMLSIPTAIIATFMGLKFFGFTLNTFTMLGLTLAVGLVVDDNIMILENISRKFKEGHSKVKASLLGTKEVSFAALAASTAIIAIFMPLGFMKGITGKYFFEFAITICVAIAFSFVDAVTLTPMRTSFMLGEDKQEGKRWIDRVMNWMEDLYHRTLVTCLKHKWLVIGGALVIFSSTYFIFNSLKREFVPPQDQSRLIIFMKTKAGSSLEYTQEKVREIENILMKQDELQRYFVAIGGFSGTESNTAFGYITLKPVGERPVNTKLGKKLTQQQFADYLKGEMKDNVKGIMAFIRDPSLGGFGGGSDYPIEFSLTGPDFGVLQELSENMKVKLEESKLMVEADSNFKGLIPEVHILPDRKKALERGVAIDQIGKTIQSMVSGVVAGKFSKGGRRYDIKVKVTDGDLKEISDITKIKVRNNRGQLIPLNEVTRIEEVKGLLSVTREDRARAVRLTANLAPGVAQSDALDFIQTKLAGELPPEYSLIVSGSSKTYNESFESLIFVIVLGLMIAYMILASQFNSFVSPLTILAALPFSFTGAFIALKLGGQTLNMYSMIGLILLMGIVKKNSIILVDFTNQLRAEGMNVNDALLKACPIRLRPIFMTSVSTIAGTMPAALALGPGAETRIPMALAVIGGLLFSTVLTLIIVPCIYSIMPGHVSEERALL